MSLRPLPSSKTMTDKELIFLDKLLDYSNWKNGENGYTRYNLVIPPYNNIKSPPVEIIVYNTLEFKVELDGIKCHNLDYFKIILKDTLTFNEYRITSKDVRQPYGYEGNDVVVLEIRGSEFRSSFTSKDDSFNLEATQVIHPTFRHLFEDN